MSKRTDSPKKESKAPVNLNFSFFSNNKIEIGGKSILYVVLALIALLVVPTLVASGSDSETLISLVRSLTNAFGS